MYTLYTSYKPFIIVPQLTLKIKGIEMLQEIILCKF